MSMKNNEINYRVNEFDLFGFSASELQNSIIPSETQGEQTPF